jgi:FkbM family methyltransferase
MSHALGNMDRFYQIIPTGIIHIGANKGQEVVDYKESGIRPVVLIEPLEDPFRRLVSAIADEPGFFPVCECLSDVSGRKVDFHIASNGGQSSSYFPPEKHLELYPHVKFDQKIEMTTRTLDEVIESLSTDLDARQLDYISLDTQGSELDILKGGMNALSNAKFVFSEVSFPGLYKGAPDLYDIIDFMRKNGFDICQLVMRNKGWGDALFARKGTISK